MNKTTEFDVIIMGGGLSGFTLGVALANFPLKIAIINSNKAGLKKVDKDNFIKPAVRDLRALALSYISQKIFQKFKLWDALLPYAYPIKHVHVSDQGHFGFARMHSTEYQLDNFGFVVPMESLLDVLQTEMQKFQNLHVYNETHLIDIKTDSSQALLTFQSGNDYIALTSKLMVGADGTHSKLREKLQIKTKIRPYQQVAIVANVGVERPHNGTAYERFTQKGPLALLPISDNAFSIVWTQTSAEADAILTISEADFLRKLQQDFGYRLGRFTWTGARQSFPLSLSVSEKITADRTLLIGNAAHTLHPIAGQGFNLGLRDIAALVELIEQSLINNRDIGSFINLTQFKARREKDINSTIKLTDSLVKIFSNNLLPINLLRNFALLGLDISPIKKKLAKQAMGFTEYTY